jgi:hypothetical protein
MKEREKGPIEILCKEIGFRFDRHLEQPSIFIAFVGVLIDRIAEMREMQVAIGGITGSHPSEQSGVVLQAAREIFEVSPTEMTERAAALHGYIDLVAPEDDPAPCDHLIDMVNSCVSAIRFGLETPCRSRHAAEACGHIWRHLYGVTLEDDFTPNWKKDWARAQLQQAITSLALTAITP